jgi:hypothetical protein
VPPSLSFRGEDLRAVLLPAAARPGTGHVLALEVYRDGVIVRAAIHDATSGPAALRAPESLFELIDDAGGAYPFAGSVAGGTPTTHVMAMFGGTPAPDASWLEAQCAIGWARFDLRRPG